MPKMIGWLSWRASSTLSLGADVSWSSLVGAALMLARGGGSIAVWLAERVGESGPVVATDIDLTYLKRLNVSNLEVRQHNIIDDPVDALGPGSFDLVCTFDSILARRQAGGSHSAQGGLFAAGRWLVHEDGEWAHNCSRGSVSSLLCALPPHYARYHRAWRGGEWWESRGYDPIFGRKLPVLFEHCGLENIRREATAEVVRGGSPWALWWHAALEAICTWEQAKDTVMETREEEYKTLLAPWTDPSFWFLNALVHACWGQRPAH